MLITMAQFATISGVGLVAGVLSAMTGGSGMIVLPALLMAGVPPHYALGTNKLYTTSSLLTSAMTFMRQGLFNPRVWGMIIVATLFGAGVGALLVQLFDSDCLSKILPIFILGVAVYFIFSKSISNKIADIKASQQQSKQKHSLLVGSLLGIYSGFFGAGTGSICTAIGVSVFKMTMLEASAMSRFICFIANAVALLTFVVMNRVDYHIGTSLIILGSIGAYCGTKLTVKLGGDVLRIMIIVISSIMGLTLFYKAWF